MQGQNQVRVYIFNIYNKLSKFRLLLIPIRALRKLIESGWTSQEMWPSMFVILFRFSDGRIRKLFFLLYLGMSSIKRKRDWVINLFVLLIHSYVPVYIVWVLTIWVLLMFPKWILCSQRAETTNLWFSLLDKYTVLPRSSFPCLG